MKTTMAVTLAILGLSAACSSGSSSGPASESCENFNSQSTITGMATLTSGSSICPQSIPLDVSSADAAAPNACAPTVNGCTAAVSCTQPSASGASTSIEAQVSVSGNTLSGTETVTVTVSGNAPVTCQYKLVGTVG